MLPGPVPPRRAWARLAEGFVRELAAGEDLWILAAGPAGPDEPAPLVAGETAIATDALGEFAIHRYTLADVPGVAGLKHYPATGLVVASLEDLAPGGRYELRLGNYARGLALRRHGTALLGPVLGTDPRLVPEECALLLWQRLEDPHFYGLVPPDDVRFASRPGLAPGHVELVAAPGATGSRPLFVYGRGDDPFALVARLAGAARHAGALVGTDLAWGADDCDPEVPYTSKEHVHRRAYNALWASQFGLPSQAAFSPEGPGAELHAVAGALAGGEARLVDDGTAAHAALARQLALSDGRTLRPNAPGLVTRDSLLVDPALEPVPIKLFAPVRGRGYTAAVVAALNVNKTAVVAAGRLRAADVERLYEPGALLAVYVRGTREIAMLDASQPEIPFRLGEWTTEVFTVVPVQHDAAVFGLLDNILGAAAVTAVARDGDELTVWLAEAGDFGAWLARKPALVAIDGAPTANYFYAGGLLTVPAAAFGERPGPRRIGLLLR